MTCQGTGITVRSDVNSTYQPQSQRGGREVGEARHTPIADRGQCPLPCQRRRSRQAVGEIRPGCGGADRVRADYGGTVQWTADLCESRSELRTPAGENKLILIPQGPIERRDNIDPCGLRNFVQAIEYG